MKTSLACAGKSMPVRNATIAGKILSMGFYCTSYKIQREDLERPLPVHPAFEARVLQAIEELDGGCTTDEIHAAHGSIVLAEAHRRWLIQQA